MSAGQKLINSIQNNCFIHAYSCNYFLIFFLLFCCLLYPSIVSSILIIIQKRLRENGEFNI